MNEIKRIRQSIAKRSQSRQFSVKNVSIDRDQPYIFPQEEEKHGYYPTYEVSSTEKTDEGKLQHSIFLKITLSVILFVVFAILSKTNVDFLVEPKQWAKGLIEEDFPFATVHQWYQESFGDPFIFTAQERERARETAGNEEEVLPVFGKVTESFQVNGSGIMISPERPAPVHVLESGFVVFAGKDRTLGQKVVVQHPDRSKTTYGLLSSTEVHLYQLIEKNQRIGTFDPKEDHEAVYFSIQKNNQYVDPIQVIKVDDLQ